MHVISYLSGFVRWWKMNVTEEEIAELIEGTYFLTDEMPEILTSGVPQGKRVSIEFIDNVPHFTLVDIPPTPQPLTERVEELQNKNADLEQKLQEANTKITQLNSDLAFVVESLLS